MELEVILGSNVRGFRKKLGLTIEALSEKADLHPSSIGEIERARTNVTIETIGKLAPALEVEAYVLLIKGAFLDASHYQRKVR